MGKYEAIFSPFACKNYGDKYLDVQKLITFYQGGHKKTNIS